MAERTIDLASRDGFAIPQEEAVADGAITPGMLLALQSTGKLKANATAAKKMRCVIAVENELFSGVIATAYASGDHVFAKTFPPGAPFYGFLDAGETAVKGTLLVPSTGGSFKAKTAGVDDMHVMAEAQEAVDLATSTSTGRIILKAI